MERLTHDLILQYRAELQPRNFAPQRMTTLSVLAETLLEICELPHDVLAATRLLREGERNASSISQSLKQKVVDFAHLGVPSDSSERSLWAARRLGSCLDMLHAGEQTQERKKWGSYFTPQKVASDLTQRAFASLEKRLDASLESSPLSVCDPAVGGGAFLLEAMRLISERKRQISGCDVRAARWFAVRGAYGIDRSQSAIYVTEAALCLFAECDVSHATQRQLLIGDALVGRGPQGTTQAALPQKEEWAQLRLHIQESLPELFHGDSTGFDWIVGNPPWVAFQGRATQKIPTTLRAYYRANYVAFSGYPTLHGMFVERSAAFCPHGTISLLLPSSVADLDGYRPTRRVLTQTHAVEAPLPEYGQDAFEQVVQPCFGLIASHKNERDKGSDSSFLLEERSHVGQAASLVQVPECLRRLQSAPTLPKETFGELGFQSNTRVVEELFFKGESPPQEYSRPLLEGRRVSEFCCRKSQLFLNPDTRRLSELSCRLRPPEVYQRVDFLVRQTAAFPIAAQADGTAFRNSLIAGYAGQLKTDLLIALLNSALYRAVHVSRTRDARQATFPQVKVAHLRALPAPPSHPALEKKIVEISRAATRAGGLSERQRAQLDDLVFQLFSIGNEDATAILAFLSARAPKALAPSLV